MICEVLLIPKFIQKVASFRHEKLFALTKFNQKVEHEFF